MKKFSEAEQARLKYYIESGVEDGRVLWAVVRLTDKKTVGRYSTRSLAFVEWKRFNKLHAPTSEIVATARRGWKGPAKVPVKKPKVREVHNCKVCDRIFATNALLLQHLYGNHPLWNTKARPGSKHAIDGVAMPGMLECHKCKRLCANKEDLYAHTCLGKKIVKLEPGARARRLKVTKGRPIHRKKLVGEALRESKRKAKKRRKREARKGKFMWRRLPGSGWAGRGQR